MTAKRLVNLAVAMVATEQRRAVALLKEAADIIYEELYAAGEDDVNGNPVLLSHARTHERIRRATVNPTLRYLANVDGSPDKRGARPTTDEIRLLVEQGYAVMVSAPYPFAPSHAHLTPAGREAYERQVCGACGHEPANEWLQSNGAALCLTCGEELTGIVKSRGHGAGDCRATVDRLRHEIVTLRRERDDARYSRDAAEEELAKHIKMGRHGGP